MNDMNRKLSGALFVLAAVAAVAMFGFWFAGVWAHGHDEAARMADTGFLAMLVAGAFALLGVIARINSDD